MTDDEANVAELRAAIRSMHDSIERLHRERDKPWPTIEPMVVDNTGWNFRTYSTHINQRFADLSLQLQQRFEAQQAGVTTAMIAAEKAVNSALIAAEKAVDKAERAQELRNQVSNEFRESLSDLSGLMWTIKEGTAAVESLRREVTGSLTNTEEKITASSKERIISIEALRRELSSHIEGTDTKVTELSTTSANMQGRFTMIGIVWGIVVVVASAAIKWFH